MTAGVNGLGGIRFLHLNICFGPLRIFFLGGGLVGLHLGQVAVGDTSPHTTFGLCG